MLIAKHIFNITVHSSLTNLVLVLVLLTPSFQTPPPGSSATTVILPINASGGSKRKTSSSLRSIFSNLNKTERSSSGRGLTTSPDGDDQDTTVVPGSTQGLFRARDADTSLIATVSPLGGSQVTIPNANAGGDEAKNEVTLYDSLSLASGDFDIFSYNTINKVLATNHTTGSDSRDIRQASSEYFSLEQPNSVLQIEPMIFTNPRRPQQWPQLEQNDRLVTQEVVHDNNWILLPATGSQQRGGGGRARGAETEVVPFHHLGPDPQGDQQVNSLKRAVIGVLKFLGPQSNNP